MVLGAADRRDFLLSFLRSAHSIALPAYSVTSDADGVGVHDAPQQQKVLPQAGRGSMQNRQKKKMSEFPPGSAGKVLFPTGQSLADGVGYIQNSYKYSKITFLF